MKKILHILFATVFTILTVGVSLSKHYSNGDLFSIAFFGEAESCCEVPCDCCAEETEVIQFDKDYIGSPTHFNTEQVVIDLFSADDFLVLSIEAFHQQPRKVTYYSNLPPPKLKSTLSEIQSFLL